MYSDNKQIRDVADVAAKIMYGQQPVTEKIHPNQQQLDVHEPEKDELTADDFKKLRGKKEVKKEEVESVEEGLQQTLRKYVPGYAKAQLNKKMDAQNYASGDSTKKTVDKDVNYNRYKKVADKLNKEEVEELDELSKNTLGSYIKKANFAGGMADFKHGRIADKRGDSKEKTALAATSHKRTKGISTAVDKLSKEEVESVEEGLQQTLRKYVPGYAKAQLNKKMDAQNYASGDSTKKTVDKDVNYNRYKKVADKLNKEEVEAIDEVKMADLPSTKVQGRSYGASKPEPHAVDTLSGPKDKELKDIEAEKKKKQKKFSEMVNLYQEKGLKSLSEMLVKEEPDNEQFTKELEDAKAKSEGKKKNTEIAKGSVQAVKQEELDIDAINGVQMSTIEERHMTEPEKEKKEDIVKGMKKGMAGFKDRYGDRAKDVMDATATKQAMK